MNGSVWLVQSREVRLGTWATISRGRANGKHYSNVDEEGGTKPQVAAGQDALRVRARNRNSKAGSALCGLRSGAAIAAL